MAVSDHAFTTPGTDQFRLLFDLMPQLGWTARPDGYIDFYNRGWYEYTGTDFEQMQGWGWREVHDPEMLPKVIAQWQHSLATGTPFEMEFPLRRHDGVFRWFLTRVNPLRDPEGNILRWVGINTDIDDRRQHVRMLERLSQVGRTISADLELQSVLQAVTDAATELSGAHFGAFFYNVVNQAGEAYMLYTISGVPREHFEKFPMPRNTAIFAPTFAGEATVLIDDVHKDPRFGKNPPYHGMPEGHLPVVSYLAVPVVSRSGEVLGGLFFGHPRAGVFTLQSAQVVEGLAAQAAVTLDNARLYQRVVADRALVRQSEARYRTLVEASPTAQAVGTSNPEGYVVEDSPSWRALTGQTYEEMQGRGWLQAVHPDFREATERELDAAIANRRIYLMEFRLRMSDGTYRWFASKGVPVYDDDGTLREWIGTTSDVDQRRSTEEHLRFLARANELFASSLDYESTLRNLTQAAVPALADWCAVDMAVKSADGAYERLAVAHVDPEKTDLAWDIYRTYKPDLTTDPIAQSIRSGKSQLVREISDELLRSATSSDEHYAITKRLGLISFMIVPLLGRRGALGAITFVSSDSMRLFTELDLSHAEEFARQAAVAIENAMLYRDAQDANRAKDDFLATLSHELRTPMTSILGWSRMLEEGGLDDETFGTAIESIVRSAHAQALLIDDVLDMSRIIAGKMQMDPRPVDLADAVQAAMRTVQPAADAKGVILEMQRRPGTSLVTGDPNRLQQIVWNLLSNAIKFTPRGGEVITRIEQSGSFVRLTVRDTGKGIAPDFLPHVFEPFRQAENVTTRVHGGLGLGLAIARQLVELHGGNISAKSEGEGKGATFVIELPIRALATRDRAHPASLERSPMRHSNAPTDAAYPSLEGVRVLVVDDQPDARALVRTVLVRCGAHVTTAASVHDALERLDDDVPDIIVSDIAMPDADGYELIRHIRHTRKLPIPVIAMTAFGHPADQEKIMAAGFTGYLKKPVEPIDLARVLYAVLQRSRGTSA
jgi:PAS domain S-box-containing protein